MWNNTAGWGWAFWTSQDKTREKDQLRASKQRKENKEKRKNWRSWKFESIKEQLEGDSSQLSGRSVSSPATQTPTSSPASKGVLWCLHTWNMYLLALTGSLWVIENLVFHWIVQFHFPVLESPEIEVWVTEKQYMLLLSIGHGKLRKVITKVMKVVEFQKSKRVHVHCMNLALRFCRFDWSPNLLLPGDYYSVLSVYAWIISCMHCLHGSSHPAVSQDT